MNPLATIFAAVVASAAAAPSNYAAAPVAVAHAAAPVAVAHAAPISVPAPYTTSQVQGHAVESVHQAPQQITKQIHYGTQQYIAGYNTQVLKPVLPDLNVQVSPYLRGTQQVNAPIVTVQRQPYTVNEPYPVDRPYNVPYEVIRNVEKVVEVPTPVHVHKPYHVPVPVPVRGQDIVKVSRTAPVVQHTQSNIVAAPAYSAVGAHAIAAPAVLGHH